MLLSHLKKNPLVSIDREVTKFLAYRRKDYSVLLGAQFRIPLALQMSQLGNLKSNMDDLSEPEQFACVVSRKAYI